jgi:sugar (pentulose or hexulose) kinase
MFHVLNRTMTKIIAATIHVQTIEFVTGNGPILNSVCAISGIKGFPVSAPVCAGAADVTATAFCADWFATGGDEGCAFMFAAVTTTKNAPTKKKLNPFTFRIHVR